MAHTTAQPRSYLFVDGFNVIHDVPELRVTLQREGPGAAQDRLASLLSPLHDNSGMRLVIVMDGAGDRATSEFPFGPRGLEVLHAPAALTADGAIERMMARLEVPQASYAVSNDRMIREAVRASGGNALRPAELIDWLNESDRTTRLQLQRRQRDNKGGFGVKIEL